MNVCMKVCMEVTKFCIRKIQYISSHSSINNVVEDGFALGRRAKLVLYIRMTMFSWPEHHFFGCTSTINVSQHFSLHFARHLITYLPISHIFIIKIKLSASPLDGPCRICMALSTRERKFAGLHCFGLFSFSKITHYCVLESNSWIFETNKFSLDSNNEMDSYLISLNYP